MILKEEDHYLKLLQLLIKDLENKSIREDRTGVGCVSRFGDQLRFDLSKGFPLLTTKKVWFKGVAEELFWMLRGDTNIRSLQDKGVHIWDEWADKSGNLGPVYGGMWRNWPNQQTGSWYGDSWDQLGNVIKELLINPCSRRLVISGWNPGLLPDPQLSFEENIENGNQALPPCHCLFQFFVQEDRLSCQLYQRSADIFLGVPFNIASYSLLTHIIANICRLEVGEFIHTFGDLHLYSNHLEPAKEQLSRNARQFPRLEINRKLIIKDLDSLSLSNFNIINYNPHPSISAPIAV